MGVMQYFRIFKHNKKLHIHYGFSGYSDLEPWFISKDDVSDTWNYVHELDPETVNNVFNDNNRVFPDIISIYKTRFDDFNELYSTVKRLLTKQDFEIFKNKICELFSDTFVYDYMKYIGNYCSTFCDDTETRLTLKNFILDYIPSEYPEQTSENANYKELDIYIHKGNVWNIVIYETEYCEDGCEYMCCDIYENYKPNDLDKYGINNDDEYVLIIYKIDQEMIQIDNDGVVTYHYLQ